MSYLISAADILIRGAPTIYIIIFYNIYICCCPSRFPRYNIIICIVRLVSIRRRDVRLFVRWCPRGGNCVNYNLVFVRRSSSPPLTSGRRRSIRPRGQGYLTLSVFFPSILSDLPRYALCIGRCARRRRF
jgi:hypothetical protein